ncbi:hypothetical protein TNCV_3999131 [Trichonephila clavipes]|nr:hypothetical protein TNCV_3999131 [Trichonephila clavipes]
MVLCERGIPIARRSRVTMIPNSLSNHGFYRIVDLSPAPLEARRVEELIHLISVEAQILPFACCGSSKTEC